MALKLKKEIKKSSYYVWFLGAKEAKGLRGVDYIRPIIENLEEREKDIEPFKVTLQVSSKGLKIVQNIVSAQSNKKPKNETIKHFIPHNTITCVHQKDDIIACILLLFNPVTKCPLHVHAYRCDSLETAAMLKGQLQLLIDKPENQKKFAEIESRLLAQEKKDKKERLESSIGSSDTGTSTKSESSEERFSSDVRVATLYDSVAAELRAKLNKNDVPILLPPRDYDTVHRQKGNLTGIELRRCLNVNIVGQNIKAKRMASSGGSSGIGSDHAPSPESPDVHQERYQDGHSTSDEDWNADQDTGLYLIDQPSYQAPLSKYDYRAEQRKPRQFDQKVTRQHLEEHIRKKLEQRNKYQGQESFNYKEDYRNERNAGTSPQHPAKHEETSHYLRNGRFSYEEVDDTLKRSRGRSAKEVPIRDPRDSRDSRDSRDVRESRDSRDSRDVGNGKDSRDGRYKDREVREVIKERTDARTLKDQRGREVISKDYRDSRDVREVRESRDSRDGRDMRTIRDLSPDLPYQEQFIDIQVSPRERFNDAKEKFLLLEKRTSNASVEYFREVPISPICKENKRNSRYYDEEPIPAPRSFNKTSSSEERRPNSREAPTPLERYRVSQQKVDKYDLKRRSMFNLSTSPTSPPIAPSNEYVAHPPNYTNGNGNNHYAGPGRNGYDHSRYPDEALSKEMKRRSFMDQAHYRNGEDFRDVRDSRDPRDPREFARDPRDSRESRDPKLVRDWVPARDARETREFREYRDNREISSRDRIDKDLKEVHRDSRDHRDPTRESRDARDMREIRDGREGVRDVQMRDNGNAKFGNKGHQRYRNSYAEPISHGMENARKFPPLTNANNRGSRFDVLHRTNSTVSNNGRVGIASVHPY